MIYGILLLTSLLPIGVCIGSTFLGQATYRLVVVIACRRYARFSGLSIPAVSKIVLELHCTSRVTRKRLVVNSRTPCSAKDTSRVRSYRSKGLATVSATCLPRAFSYLGCGFNIKCSCRCSPALPYDFPVRHQSRRSPILPLSGCHTLHTCSRIRSFVVQLAVLRTVHRSTISFGPLTLTAAPVCAGGYSKFLCATPLSYS